jgi:hypothetical protein
MDKRWMGLVPGAVSGRGRLGSDSPPASSSPTPCVHACMHARAAPARCSRAPRAPLSHFLFTVRVRPAVVPGYCSPVYLGPAGFLAWRRKGSELRKCAARSGRVWGGAAGEEFQTVDPACSAGARRCVLSWQRARLVKRRPGRFCERSERCCLEIPDRGFRRLSCVLTL